MAKTYAFRKAITYEGKRYEIRADSEIELYKKIALKIRDLEEGKVVTSGDMLFKDWVWQCFDAYGKNLAERTRKVQKGKIDKHIVEKLGHMKIKQIKPIHCQQALNELEGYSKDMIKFIHQKLNFFFNKAIDNKLILENPAKNIVRPSGTQKHFRAITEYERKHIIEVAKTERRFYVYLIMLYCGLRTEEAANVMGKDLYIHKDQPMLHVRGTKTRRAERNVPIPLELWEIIKDTPKFEYVACSANGLPYKNSTLTRLWVAFKRPLNLSMGCKMYRNQLIPPLPVADDLYPYCLRHTYCTDLARKGIDVRTAQKLMGHADISTTVNIYTNLDLDDIINEWSKGATVGATLLDRNIP